MEQGGILIIDDNEICREICAINLETLDVPLHFADNGATGLQRAADLVPDLILLDIMMPVMDGFQMLHELKKQTALAKIPVLILTAKSETESIVKALESGANDYLKKPFAEEEMVARVKTLLRNSFLEKQVRQDIRNGAAIQRKFLTDSAATTSLFEDADITAATFNQPYGTVSGDFFYTFRRQHETLIFLGDSCGHGLPAALISMRILGFLQQLSQLPYSPMRLLSILNQDIKGLLPAGKFVAASCLSFSAELCTLSNAAQSYPVLITEHGVEEVILDGFPLGIDGNCTYKEKGFQFKQGDRLLLYTDGMTEATDDNEVPYGKDRLHRYLHRFPPTDPLDTMLSGIIDDVRSFTGDTPLDDDLTLILLEKR